MDMTSSTREAAKVQLLIGALVGLPSCFQALAWFGGASPYLPLVAVAPAYLGWIWVTDVIALLRNRDVRPRPLYRILLVLALIALSFWIGWLTKPTA